MRKIGSHSEDTGYASNTQKKKNPATPKRFLSVKQMEMLNYSANQIHYAVKENWSSPTARSQYVDYLKKEGVC